jgi:hypothetical protein
MAFDFAKLAMELGKDSLWHYAKQQHPVFCEYLSPHGPRLVRAGREELRDAPYGGRYAPDARLESGLDFSRTLPICATLLHTFHGDRHNGWRITMPKLRTIDSVHLP